MFLKYDFFTRIFFIFILKKYKEHFALFWRVLCFVAHPHILHLKKKKFLIIVVENK